MLGLLQVVQLLSSHAVVELEAGGRVHLLARRQLALARLLRDRLGRLPLRLELVPLLLDLRVHRVLHRLQQVLSLALEAEAVLLALRQPVPLLLHRLRALQLVPRLGQRTEGLGAGALEEAVR